VLFEEQITEHHVHHPNIGDNTVTYEALNFFGFGAAGAPKWHGENSESGADITVAASEGANPDSTEFENTGSPTAGTVAVTNAVTVRVENLTEGAAVSVIANETVGTQRVGDIIMEDLAGSDGAAQITDFNYEGAFDPSGLDVVVRARQSGIPNGAQVSDNGSFTDWTQEANASTIGWGANFDGTNDFFTRGANLTGLADGKEGTISFWFKRGGGTGAIQRLLSSGGADTAAFFVRFANNDTIRVLGQNAGNTDILDANTLTAITDTDTWHHCIMSWDLLNGVVLQYVDDVDDVDAAPTVTNDTIDYVTTPTDYTIGALSGGSEKFNGDLAEFWFDDSFIDISVTKNRREFITVNSTPAYLGADGSQPTGTAPLVYLGNSNRFDTWENNRGSGGGFTENGTLTDGGNVTDVIMYPTTPVVDEDSFYIGHAEEFAGIKLDIVVAAGGSPTITPQYWNGAWTSLSGVTDNTSDLTTTGENKITWTLPGDWSTSTEGGLGPFHWMRLLFDAGTMTTNPEVRRVTLDVARYRPFVQERTITSDGLTVVATWVEDTIGQF
jgi:hypothetical protein